jgi:hypothetical protein
MSKKLEKYLLEHRASMDVESPDDAVIWEGIRKGLHQDEIRLDRRRRQIRIRNIAAVVIILVSVGYMVMDLTGAGSMGKEITLADIDRHLGAREKEYRTQVDLKFKEAGSFHQVDNLIIAELLDEIQKLDVIYEQTMQDLNELGYNEQVIHTLFDTYEKKIYLLELIILENDKSHFHENDETLFL